MKTKRRFTNCLNLRFLLNSFFGILVLLILSYVFLPQFTGTSYADATVTSEVTLSLSPVDTSRSDYYISFTKPDATYGSFGTVGINANVITENSYGYSLYMRTDNYEGRLLPAVSSYGRQQYIGTISQSYSVTDSSGTGFSEMNKYGWSTDWNPTTGRGTFNKMQTTDMLLKTETQATTSSGSDTQIYVGAKVNDRVMQGTYHGTFIFTAITNPEPVYDTYTLVYDMNGGDLDPTTFSNQTYTTTASSPTATFTINTSVPTYTSHVFLGWDTDRNATTPTYVSDGSSVTPASITPSSLTTTLYAIWSTVPTSALTMAAASPITYTLNYDANGGTGAPASSSKIVNSSSTTIAISSTIPTRENYTFKGWAWTAGTVATEFAYSDGVFEPASVSLTSSQATRTLYAVWESANTQTASSGQTTAQGVVTYEEDNTLAAVLAVGAGVAVASSSFVILFLAKKKKDEDDELNVVE